MHVCTGWKRGIQTCQQFPKEGVIPKTINSQESLLYILLQVTPEFSSSSSELPSSDRTNSGPQKTVLSWALVLGYQSRLRNIIKSDCLISDTMAAKEILLRNSSPAFCVHFYSSATANCVSAGCGSRLDLAAKECREFCHRSQAGPRDLGKCILSTVLMLVSFYSFLSYPNHRKLLSPFRS